MTQILSAPIAGVREYAGLVYQNLKSHPCLTCGSVSDQFGDAQRHDLLTAPAERDIELSLFFSLQYVPR